DILHGVDLDADAGETVVIVGANGAGKSTLMKAIAGLVRVRTGAIAFAGDAIANAPAERMILRGLAYVPQERNVFASLTVEENLATGAFARPAETVAGMARVFALFPDLAEKRRVAAGRLSGGQRQMVAIGRALMLEPRLIMLD